MDYAVWGALQDMVYQCRSFRSVQVLRTVSLSQRGSNYHKCFLTEVNGGVALNTQYSVINVVI